MTLPPIPKEFRTDFTETSESIVCILLKSHSCYVLVEEDDAIISYKCYFEKNVVTFFSNALKGIKDAFFLQHGVFPDMEISVSDDGSLVVEFYYLKLFS